MKLTLNKIWHGEDEIVVRYREMNSSVSHIVECIKDDLNTMLGDGEKRLTGYIDKEQYLLRPHEVLYLESVDHVTYAYTAGQVYRIPYTLNEMERMYIESGYFRCSKSTIINVYKIESLKSISGNRIDAAMENGEHVEISRRYAKELRALLKGGLGE